MAEEKETKEETKEEAKPEPKREEKPAEEDVVVDAKFKPIVDALEKLTVVDLADLVTVLEKKFHVSAVAPAAAGGGAGGAAEEKSEVNVKLESAGDQKINVIKVVKELSGLGLKEAKALVDGAPGVVKENVKRAEAEEFKQKLEAVGATVTLE